MGVVDTLGPSNVTKTRGNRVDLLMKFLFWCANLQPHLFKLALLGKNCIFVLFDCIYSTIVHTYLLQSLIPGATLILQEFCFKFGTKFLGQLRQILKWSPGSPSFPSSGGPDYLLPDILFISLDISTQRQWVLFCVSFIAKGQLISEGNFGVFKSRKQWTFFVRVSLP